MLGLIGLIVAN